METSLVIYLYADMAGVAVKPYSTERNSAYISKRIQLSSPRRLQGRQNCQPFKGHGLHLLYTCTTRFEHSKVNDGKEPSLRAACSFTGRV